MPTAQATRRGIGVTRQSPTRVDLVIRNDGVEWLNWLAQDRWRKPGQPGRNGMRGKGIESRYRAARPASSLDGCKARSRQKCRDESSARDCYRLQVEANGWTGHRSAKRRAPQAKPNRWRFCAGSKPACFASQSSTDVLAKGPQHSRSEYRPEGKSCFSKFSTHTPRQPLPQLRRWSS